MIEAGSGDFTGWLKKIFATDLKYKGALDSYIGRVSPENKLEILKQVAADPDGVGKIGVKNGQLIYVPAKSAKE